GARRDPPCCCFVEEFVVHQCPKSTPSAGPMKNCGPWITVAPPFVWNCAGMFVPASGPIAMSGGKSTYQSTPIQNLPRLPRRMPTSPASAKDTQPGENLASFPAQLPWLVFSHGTYLST